MPRKIASRIQASEAFLAIQRLPLSPNRLRYKHWRIAYLDKKDWVNQIMVAMPAGNRVKQAAKARRSVQVRLFYASSPLDPDNLHGALKPILDALKVNRLIWDDSEEWLSYTVSQQKVATRKEQRTEIEIARRAK